MTADVVATGTPPRAVTRAVAVVTVGNLLPLALVFTGSLDLPLLLIGYGIEAVLLPRHPTDSVAADLKLRAAAAGISLVFLVRAIGLVDWSVETLLVLLATVVLTLAGTWIAVRDPDAAVRGGVGAVSWRMLLLLIGGVVALSYAQDLTVLLASGWTPEPLDGSPLVLPAQAFNELVFWLGLEPLAAAALVFVVFKTVNEALWTALRGLGPTTGARPNY